MTLFYLHWNEKELKERIAPLKELKLKIHSHWSTEDTAKWGETLPDIFVISLDRLPSHGRQYAEWLWEAKKRQHIPIIFVDGQPEKVEATKAKFPKAIYCTSAKLVPNIKKLL
jgi:hypothetical protein